MRLVQAGQRLIFHLLEETTLVGGDRLAAFAFQRQLRVVRDAVDADLEMKVRARRPTGHSNIADGRTHRDSAAGTHSGREIPHVAVSTDHSVSVPDVDHVAVPTLNSGKDNNAIADRADRRAHRRRVVGTGVIAPLAEERMLTQTENAADPTERDRRAQEGCTQGHSARVVVLPSAGSRGVKVNCFERIGRTRKGETRAKNFIDDDRPVEPLETLYQQVELVTLPEVAAHVDLVFENVGQRPGELVAG